MLDTPNNEDLRRYYRTRRETAQQVRRAENTRLDEPTLNERFDHDVYFTLQTLYSRMIYEKLPNHQKEVLKLR